MSEKPLILFGTGEIAEVAHFYFTRDTPRKVAAFACDEKYLVENTLHKLPVIAFETIEKDYPAQDYDMFIAMGYSKLNKVRKQKYLQAKAKGYKLASYVSSKATVWTDNAVGDNCFILEHNNIQPFSRIGNNVTLWSGNHIGHHSRIGDHCFIASHVVISGGVVIEESCFIGVNATLRDHIVVASECIIGAGAYISHNTLQGKVYPGTRSRQTVSSSAIEQI